MKNRQVAPDATALAGLVERLAYKRGWSFALVEIDRGQGCQGLTLVIEAEVTDTTNPAGTVTFCHLMPVPPAAYDEETWQRWLLDQVLLVELHENLEFFRIDGEAPYWPEHAPGRDPYAIAQIKSREQAHAPAKPWSGGPADDPHFS